MSPFSRTYGTIASTVMVIAITVSLLITGANYACKKLNEFDDKSTPKHEARL